MKNKKHAFTLVELLVVIGIIALLISMLLPALNKARQQANLIDCQARLHTIGQTLQIYTTENRGFVPWACISRNPDPALTGVPDWLPTWTASNSDGEAYWWWYFTLGNLMSKKMVDNTGHVTGLSSVFEDKDTISSFSSNSTVLAYKQHYTCNNIIFYGNTVGVFAQSVASGGATAPIEGNDIRPRNIGSIKPASAAFAIWDAPQIAPNGDNAYGMATGLDYNELTYGHAFVLSNPNAFANNISYDNPVGPGWGSGEAYTALASIRKNAQKTFNQDFPAASPNAGTVNWLSALRFRHINNTTLNALCLDGHVETRLVGAALVRDFCTNMPN